MLLPLLLLALVLLIMFVPLLLLLVVMLALLLSLMSLVVVVVVVVVVGGGGGGNVGVVVPIIVVVVAAVATVAVAWVACLKSGVAADISCGSLVIVVVAAAAAVEVAAMLHVPGTGPHKLPTHWLSMFTLIEECMPCAGCIHVCVAIPTRATLTYIDCSLCLASGRLHRLPFGHGRKEQDENGHRKHRGCESKSEDGCAQDQGAAECKGPQEDCCAQDEAGTAEGKGFEKQVHARQTASESKEVWEAHDKG